MNHIHCWWSYKQEPYLRKCPSGHFHPHSLAVSNTWMCSRVFFSFSEKPIQFILRNYSIDYSQVFCDENAGWSPSPFFSKPPATDLYFHILFAPGDFSWEPTKYFISKVPKCAKQFPCLISCDIHNNSMRQMPHFIDVETEAFRSLVKFPRMHLAFGRWNATRCYKRMELKAKGCEYQRRKAALMFPGGKGTVSFLIS